MNRAMFSSASDRWATPKAVYAALDREFRFNYDPCPLDGHIDGLSPLFSDWSGKRVFCNPPYGPGTDRYKVVPRHLPAQCQRDSICERASKVWRRSKLCTVSIHDCDIRRVKERTNP